MTDDRKTPPHPAPHRDRVRAWEAWFGVVGAPLAWFVHLCASSAFASDACFESGTRTYAPTDIYPSGYPLVVILCGVSLLIAGAAIFVSLRLLRRTRGEAGRGDRHLLEMGGGRTHFLAMSGLFLGIGFATVILVNAVALFAVPPCSS